MLWHRRPGPTAPQVLGERQRSSPRGRGRGRGRGSKEGIDQEERRKRSRMPAACMVASHIGRLPAIPSFLHAPLPIGDSSHSLCPPLPAPPPPPSSPLALLSPQTQSSPSLSFAEKRALTMTSANGSRYGVRRSCMRCICCNGYQPCNHPLPPLPSPHTAHHTAHTLYRTIMLCVFVRAHHSAIGARQRM